MQTVEKPLPSGTIFISFRSSRRDVANQLYSHLKDNRFRPWLDRVNLAEDIGESFAANIQQALSQSAVFIVLFSKDYFESPWCVRELNQAFAEKKRIIPVVLGDLRDIPFPAYVRAKTLQYAFLGTTPSEDARTLDLIMAKLLEWRISRDPKPAIAPRILRAAAIPIVAVLLIGAIVFGVYRVYVELNRPCLTCFTPIANTPENARSVRLIAAAPDDTLYYVAMVSDSESSSRIHLYHFDPQAQTHVDLGVMSGDFARALHVDCAGTVWLLTQGGAGAGIYTYPGNFQVVYDHETSGEAAWSLTASEQLAIESRCIDSIVEVWLTGSETVFTVRYDQSSRPTLADLLPINDDPDAIHTRIRDSIMGVSLSYQDTTGKLWLVDALNNRLLSFEVDFSQAPEIINDSSIQYSTVAALGQEIYLLNTRGIYRLNTVTNRLDQLSTDAAAYAVLFRNTLWFVNPCGLNCPSIGVYYDGSISFAENRQFSVYDMVSSSMDRLYFATDEGIYIYSK